MPTCKDCKREWTTTKPVTQALADGETIACPDCGSESWTHTNTHTYES